ncbi:MAG: class I SAM-dependent methyltransferase [Planctomycetaceae bacterium]|nr:class I SAM-dependent methyltransferase [Planctomycetaceae bacterium]
MEKTIKNDLKLHLGCGEIYIDGYTNIDFPNSEHTVQHVKADKYADITKLDFPKNSVEEIRLHHVFEHFSRPVALALICKWRDWLKPGGLLRIETPDVMKGFTKMVLPWISRDAKQQIMRHIFGSHEADWAIHKDGWYRVKFKNTLTALGFKKLIFKKSRWQSLNNIEVRAYKGDMEMSFLNYKEIVQTLLKKSCITIRRKRLSGSELQMLDVWLEIFEKTYKNL